MNAMANTTLEEGELEQSICSVVEKSWFEECEQADHEMTNRCSAPGKVAPAVADPTSIATVPATATPIDDDDSFLATKDTSCNSNSSGCGSGSEHSTSSGDREILVSFLDVSNEMKFDRLLEKKKIKPTFKRCLSPTSASESSSDSKRPSATAANAAAAKTANDKNDDDDDDDDGSHKVIGRREPRDESPDSSERSSSSAGKRTREIESDVGILDRRQKQIDYGKNTVGYDEYMKQVPREKRSADHPWTPQKNIKYSRRAFDGLVKIWRKKLHCYDPSNIHGVHHENADDNSV